MSSPELNSVSMSDPIVAAIIEQAMQAALNRAAEGIHWVAFDGTILWANQTELDLLGYTADQYIGHHISEFHLDQSCINDILARLTHRETLDHYPARLRHRDGSVRHVEINSNVLWEGERFLRTQCFTRDVTEQRVADETIRQLAQIVENSEDAVISQDLDGIITSWNAAAERLYGYTKADAVKQSIHLIIPAERRDEESRGIDRIRRGERVPSFDTVRMHKDGSPLDVALTLSPILDRNGRVTGASKTARNITDRKRIEARDRFLINLDDAVRSLSDAEAITLTAAKALGLHLAVNRCAYATVGDDQDTFTLTGNFTDGVHSIVGRYTFRQFGTECLRLMRAGEPYVVANSGVDARLDADDRRSYAKTAIAAVICVPVMKQGQLVAAMAVHMKSPRQWQADEVELVQRVANRCWESIERAKVTHTLRESEARFRSLASTNSALTLYEQDTELRYTWVFPSHEEFASDNIGKTDAQLLPADEGERLSQLKREVLQTGIRRSAEITVTLPNDVRTYDLVIEPRFDSAGDAVGIGGIAIDITDRKNHEVLLARAQQIARDSEEHLREANRRKDEFLAILAHELRNPLAPIRTGLHLIRLAGDSPQAVHDVRSMMERQLTHVVRLVDDLLDVSRITSGKIHLRQESVGLQQLVDGAIEANRAGIDAAGIQLEVDLRDPCQLFVDPTRATQIISNVLNNAVKFAGTNGRVGILGVVESSGGAVEARIEISDSGAGMSPAMLPKIFELFVQDDREAKRQHGGLGIGLALAKTLIEMHGGTIEAASAGVGCGSTFTMRFPVVQTIGDAAEPRDHPAKAVRRRVLIVDDHADSAEVLAMLIRNLGGAAATANDGETAIKQVREFAADTVLLDIGLPGIDGYETCRRIRAEHGERVRVIAISGWGQEQDKQRALDAGFDMHLTKPVDPLVLETVLGGAAKVS